tara:strand:- start:530 stop:1240 length:711 start_codon:yes stop_codon:yes gene_type:complete
MKILIGACTKHSREEFEKSPLYKSMLSTLKCEPTTNHLLYTGDYQAVVKLNNQDTICAHYNLCIEMAVNEGFDYLLLVHDDISIEDKFLDEKIHQALASYDVVGLAGAKQVQIKEPALWHVMSNQNDWSGAVAHRADSGQVFVTNFGDTPQRCLVLDGLFMAIKVSSLTDKVRFDTENPGRWHLYDLDFSLTCNKHGLKLTTWPIWVIHDSPGLSQPSEEFSVAQKYFIEKWTQKS